MSPAHSEGCTPATINHLDELNIYLKQARVNAEGTDAVGDKVVTSASFKDRQKKGTIEKVARGRVPVSEQTEGVP